MYLNSNQYIIITMEKDDKNTYFSFLLFYSNLSYAPMKESIKEVSFYR